MKDKLNRAIELLKNVTCPICSNWSDGACSWCIKRDLLLAEVESSEDKEECEHPYANILMRLYIAGVLGK